MSATLTATCFDVAMIVGMIRITTNFNRHVDGVMSVPIVILMLVIMCSDIIIGLVPNPQVSTSVL